MGTGELLISNADALLHEGNYSVVVTVDNCIVESIDLFVDVYEQPTTSIASVPAVACTDGSGMIQFDGIPGSGVPGYTYAWTGPNGFTSTLEDPQLTNITSTMSGTYTFQVTDANGCESEVASVEVSIDEGIEEPVLAYSGQACDQGTATLSIPAYAGSSVTYTWTTPAGVTQDITGLNTNEITIDPISAIHEGTYSVMVTVDGCTATTDAFPVALAEPATMTLASTSGVICHEGELGLFANPVGDGVLEFSWTGPNGFTSSQENPMISNATTLNNGTYTLVITNGNGCQSTADIIVSNVEAQVVSGSIIANGPICEDEPLVLETSQVCDTYLWIGPDGDSPATLANPLLTTSTPTTTIPVGDVAYDAGMWSLICVDANGCESEMAAAVAVDINVIPQAIATNNGSVCPGASVQLFANEIPGATYTWTEAGSTVVVSNEQNPIIPTITATTTYELLVEVAGCGSALANTQVVMTAAPVILPVANHTVAADCSPQDLFLISGATGSGLLEYAWTGPSGFISTVSDPTLPNVQSANNGTYTVIVTDENGCTAQAQVEVIDIEDTIADPDIASSGPACEGDPISISVPDFNGANVTYTWTCLLYTSPSPRDQRGSRMPSSA